MHRVKRAGTAFTDDHRPTAVTEFEWGEVKEIIDALVEVDQAGDPLERIDEETYDSFRKGLEALFRWIYQDPYHRNLEGIQIRALIIAWICIPDLHPLTLTQLARMYGKHKQSFGRWVDDFKRHFPRIRNCHMKQ
jgi:hypothetical protein